MIKECIRLASKSPRRSQLLKESAILFEVVPIEVEETYPPELKAEEIPVYLAKLKGEAAIRTFGLEIAILTADSIVSLQNEVLEKPKSKEEAKTMLRALSGRTHTVFTGYCIHYRDKVCTRTVSTAVEMDHISEKEIEFYTTQFTPLDKAGAYGIQEWIGHCKVKAIHGSYTNVMGLPMREVYQSLSEIFTS